MVVVIIIMTMGNGNDSVLLLLSKSQVSSPPGNPYPPSAHEPQQTRGGLSRQTQPNPAGPNPHPTHMGEPPPTLPPASNVHVILKFK